MANNDNIIYARFNHGHEITTDPRSQYAYGQVVKISGLHLPASFDADAVQTKINWVINTAQSIKDGQPWAKEHYGNDEKREKALGSWYPVVQKQINVLYGIEKW